MRKRAIVNIAAVVLTAVISAFVLYQTLFAGHLLQEAGLLGIFLASMFSHLTVIGRDMFVPAFINLMKYYNPVVLGFSAGLGAAIGEVTTYYWGIGIQEAFKDDSQSQTVKKWIEKYGFVAILLVASSPLPDTPIVLLAGTTRFPFKKFIVIQMIGKTTYYSLGAVVGGAIFQGLSSFMEEWILSAVVLAGSIVLCVLASWSKSRDWILSLLRKIFH
jgi:membrane protein YqaA with SNARE-associated domain